MSSSDPVVLLQQASVWQQDGETERAEAAYRRVLSLDPANPDAMNLLALVHHEHGDRETAIRLLRAAISIRPAARPSTARQIPTCRAQPSAGRCVSRLQVFAWIASASCRRIAEVIR